jgi:hypothetical protein
MLPTPLILKVKATKTMVVVLTIANAIYGKDEPDWVTAAVLGRLAGRV